MEKIRNLLVKLEGIIVVILFIIVFIWDWQQAEESQRKIDLKYGPHSTPTVETHSGK